MKSLIAFAIMIAAATSAFSQTINTIEGKMEIAKNMFVLVSDKPVTGTEAGNKVTSKRVMLVGYRPEQVGELKKLAGKRVQAIGIIGPAFSPHHTEPLVIVISSIPKIVPG